MTPKYKFFATLMLASFAMSTNSLSAAPLTKRQMLNQIIGKKLQAKRMGMSVHILYNNNGTITLNMPITSGKGTWRFKGNQICMNMKSGPRRGVTCVTFEHLQGNRFRNSQGVDFTIQE